ncbi:lycopene cyclase domain-containing protein [Propionicimonas paludicola]|uniref:Lycopene cyclase domain-containing protein n=1 Tax=Propionicimonas paludicola TaxID=185243 RepID=A0A2A9CMF3_9ACTN|nr:lycopene cyclase domain-containing protein [Propionicimonas paludicola]PFG15584.1 lycopene cyclase domain-containing protein [Propionicimonas paludicola]
MAYEYLIVLAGCVLVTLPLEFVLGARVYRRPARLAAVVLPVAAIFYLWDLVAVARGHWGFNPARTSGILLPGQVPLEEALFFLVIPLCGLLTYEAVGAVLARWRARRTVIADPVAETASPSATDSTGEAQGHA